MTDHQTGCNSRGLVDDSVIICTGEEGSLSTGWWSYALGLAGNRARSEPGGTRWRTGGEVKGKLTNGVGSQYSHATSERSVSSITQADAHTSAGSSLLNWRHHRFKWTRPFRGKTKSGFCACAITFRTSYTLNEGESYKCLDRNITVFTFPEIRTFDSFTS